MDTKVIRQNHLKQHHKVFLCLAILTITIFLNLSIVSAMQIDNVKYFDKNIGKYGKYTIENFFGLGSALAELELKENSFGCTEDCYAIKEITQYNYGVLVEDVRFINLGGVDIKSYQFYIKKNNQWKKYKLGEELPAGTYTVKLEGKKDKYSIIDWQIKTHGFWTEEWAVWGGGIVTDAHTFVQSSTAGSRTDWDGFKILTNKEVKLIGIGRTAGGDCDTCGLLNADKTINVTGSFDADGNCTLSTANQTIMPDATTFYVAMRNRDGSGCTMKHVNTQSFPQVDTNIDWTGGLDGGTVDTTNANAISNITTTDVSIGTVTLNSPDDNAGVNNPITFNCSATVSGATLVNASLYHNESGTFEINTTNDMSGTSNESIFILDLAENEPTLWNCEFCDSDGDCGFGASNRTVIPDDGVPQVTINNPLPFIDFGTPNQNETLSWTIIESNLDAIFFEYDGVNTTLSGLINSTTFNISSARNLTFHVNDTLGNVNSTVVTWNYSVFLNSQIFNASVFETSSQHYSVDIISNASLSSVSLTFGTQTIPLSSNTSTIFSKANFIVPIGEGSKNISWNFTHGGKQILSFNTTQTVTAPKFELCNVDVNVTYANYTFANETTLQEVVNATIDSTWTYWLGDGSVNKTLNFVNTTTHPSYTFCLEPPDQSLNFNTLINYANTESQQRVLRIQNGAFTNATTNTKLYLLPTILGRLTRYQTITGNGDTITDVLAKVTRVLGGSTITASVSLTDDSGLVIFFLNQDALYSYVFSKSPFSDNTFVLNPNSAETYKIIMGETTTAGNATIILENTKVIILPVNSTLNNNTDITFGLNVTSGESISFMSLNITNISGTQLLFISDTSSGKITGVLNTGNLTRLIGYAIIQTENETITLSKTWIVGDFFEGDYSLSKQGKLFIEYEFSVFIRILLVLASIVGILIFLSGSQFVETSESKIIVTILLIWGFSLIGWLDTGLIVNSASQNLNTLSALSNKFGIAILSTAFATWSIIRKIRVV